MKCLFCQRTVPDLEAAAEQCWQPYFWRRDETGTLVSQDIPLCPACTQRHLRFDEDHEAILEPSLNGTRLPWFQPGKVIATPAALQAVERAGQEIQFFLDKHLGADWGDTCDDDQRANSRALKEGGRVVSMYLTLKGDAILIITEADRSVTTLMLPEEY